MLPFALYLLKVVICSGILFGYYWLMLRNKIYHRYNRFYLLATAALSLLMPLIRINIWHRANAPVQGIKLLQVVTGNGEYLDEIVLTARKNSFTAEQFLLLFYLLTSVIFLSLFIQVLLKIRTLLQQHEQAVVDNICFVNTTAKGTPFSFFKYIFWNNNIDITTTTGNQIFKHELAHVQQKHSLDKLFINGLLIIFWCNPFFWLIRKELNMIHEFMADKIAVEDSDTEAFAAMILQATYPQHRFALTNSFFYSPIKRRLLMLTKNKNPKASYIGRMLVLPLAVVLFAAFTLKTKMIKNSIAPAYEGKKITVVVDAGHGGKDIGAVSLDKSISEKDLSLAIVKKIKSLNNNSNINIILTRDNDIYQSPREKADFSNEKNADLFVSVHIDQISDAKLSKEKSGFSIWVAPDNHINVANSKLFASAILNEFNANYGLPVIVNNPQQSNSGIWILKASNCPAVLIEAGFISNKKDLAYMQSDEGQEAIAKNLLVAIEKYAVAKDLTADIEPVLDTVPVAKAVPAVSPKPSVKAVPVVKPLPAVSVQPEVKAVPSVKAVPAVSPKPSVKAVPVVEPVPALSVQPEVKAVPSVKPLPTVTKPTAKGAPAKPKNPTAKTENVKSVPDDKLFTQDKNGPTFPGGDSAWKKYLAMHLDPSAPVDEGWAEGSYKIIVSFKVNKDGSIEDIKTDKYHGSKTAEQCIDLIKKGPRWEPAMQNGVAVNAYKKQPITFLIQEE